MKILHIITSSKCWAGMEQYAFDLSRGVIAEGHDVFFVIANDGDVVHPRFEQLGKVYLLPLRSKFDVSSILALRKIIQKEKPDIIHTHQPKNIVHAHLARSNGMAIVNTIHFFIHPTFPNRLYSWIFNRADRIIAVSNFVRKRAMEVYPNLTTQKVVTILSSIERKRIKTDTIPTKKVTVGYAGRIVKEKGLEIMIEATRELVHSGVNFNLLIAGTGNDEYIDKLKQKVKKYDLSETIEFIGFVKDINDYMQQIDFALLPSIVKEAGSLMLLEYMAAGKAVITTNNGGQVEVSEDGVTGFLIDPDNANLLAEKMGFLILNIEERNKMGNAALQKFNQKLYFEQFVDKTMEVYKEALKSIKE